MIPPVSSGGQIPHGGAAWRRRAGFGRRNLVSSAGLPIGSGDGADRDAVEERSPPPDPWRLPRRGRPGRTRSVRRLHGAAGLCPPARCGSHLPYVPRLSCRAASARRALPASWGEPAGISHSANRFPLPWGLRFRAGRLRQKRATGAGLRSRDPSSTPSTRARSYACTSSGSRATRMSSYSPLPGG
jgi:hypothetical protein